MRNKDDLAARGLILPQHVLGERVGDVTHMCPDCGQPPQPFCATCHGSGNVTEEELSRWQARMWREANEAGGV